MKVRRSTSHRYAYDAVPGQTGLLQNEALQLDSDDRACDALTWMMLH